ncbi:spore protein [Oceanobacillus bengalensis]|nr:spore protein [Oceanobacillus bengalensis]
MDKSKEILNKERQQRQTKSQAIKGDKKLNGPDRPST